VAVKTSAEGLPGVGGESRRRLTSPRGNGLAWLHRGSGVTVQRGGGGGGRELYHRWTILHKQRALFFCTCHIYTENGVILSNSPAYSAESSNYPQPLKCETAQLWLFVLFLRSALWRPLFLRPQVWASFALLFMKRLRSHLSHTQPLPTRTHKCHA